MSDSLQPHELQHARLPSPSLSPWICSNSCPLSWWCHPIIILCLPLILLFSIFPNIRILSNELALHIRWPKYWSFNYSISPSNKYSELISFRINWFDLLPVQGTLKSLHQHHSSKASVLQSSAFFMAQLTSIYDYWKNHSFDYTDLVGKVISLLLNMLSRFVIAFLPRSKHL